MGPCEKDGRKGVEGVFCRVGDRLDRYGGGTEKLNKFLLRDIVDLTHPGVMTKK